MKETGLLLLGSAFLLALLALLGIDLRIVDAPDQLLLAFCLYLSGNAALKKGGSEQRFLTTVNLSLLGALLGIALLVSQLKGRL